MFTSCNDKTSDNEAIFLADMATPMGHNYLEIYADSTFQFEYRRLTKKILFEGKATLTRDTLQFMYSDLVPDFGKVAVIDGIFLTYTEGVSRELLEISLNKLTK